MAACDVPIVVFISLFTDWEAPPVTAIEDCSVVGKPVVEFAASCQYKRVTTTELDYLKK